jgi:hypothetical protein
MSEKRTNEKVELFVNETFRFCCVLVKEIAFIRYKSSMKKYFFFGKRKVVTFEEFRNMVAKEFEDGITKLPESPEVDFKTIAEKVTEDIRRGDRPKLQKMIKDTYSQLLQEIAK